MWSAITGFSYFPKCFKSPPVVECPHFMFVFVLWLGIVRVTSGDLCTWMHAPVFMQKPEKDREWPALSLSYSLEAGSLTEAGARLAASKPSDPITEYISCQPLASTYTHVYAAAHTRAHMDLTTHMHIHRKKWKFSSFSSILHTLLSLLCNYTHTRYIDLSFWFLN